MKVIVLAIGLALATAVPTTHSQPAPSAITSEKMRLAERVIITAGTQDREAIAIKVMMAAIYKNLEKNMPLGRVQLMDRIRQTMQNEMIALLPDLTQAAIRIYAANLTT